MAELPAGTVTFLFTDIEGSTRLLQRLRDAYGSVLAEHERILRAAIADAGGHVVDTQGDAVFAAFPRARAAVAAAIAAQRALAEFPWPEGGAVRVRMGMHTGEPAMGGDRYVGLGVHRAARICSAAHGGQVLFSGATRELVEDDLPPEARFADLGEHRLKDIERPERLYQLVVDGLQAEFPPPRTGAEDTATVALAEAAAGRRFVGGRRALVAVAAVIAVIAGGVAAFLLVRGGGSQAAGIAADSVGFIDAQGGSVHGDIPVDAAPTSAAFGEGALWVANSAAGTVSRIDITTRTVRQTIPVGDSPSGIAVGGGGVWVANHGDGTVSWINPQSNAVVQQIRVGAGPTAVAYGFGSVWVTNADDRTVSRIDAGSGTVAATVHTNAVGRGIAVGGGSVWVSDEATRSVVEIDPTSNSVASTATVGTGPVGVAYGDGSVWVANALDGTVSRVDATTLSELAMIPVGGGPAAVAFGGGSVWVSAEFGGRVVRIDPARNRIAASVPIRNRPEGLAAGDGGVWVAVQASGEGHRGGRLVVIGDSIDSIDPALANTTSSAAALGAVYDGLTSYRRTGGSAGTQLAPDLAAALPLPTDGGKSYRFHLRTGIRYSDGRPLRAEDFRRALEREFTLSGVAVRQGNVPHVVGAAGCRPHRPCDLSRGVIVGGPSTLTFRLTTPDPRFLLEIAGIVPVPAGTPLRDVGTKPLPSTGPYAIESYAPGRLLTIVRNRYFRVWSDARPDGYPDEIVWRVVKNADRAVRDVLAGKADLLEAVPAARVPELAARYPRQLHLLPQQATTYVFLNVRRPPFNDLRVRRALNYAVDRKRIVSLHGGALLAQPTCQIVPPTVPGYKQYCPYTIAPDASGQWKAPDLAKARALIAASGTRGESVLVWSFSYFHAESQYFVALLRQLGYRARLHYIPGLAGYFNTLNKTPSAQTGFAGWFGTQLAVDMLRTLGCHSGPATNWAHFCDPRLDAQVARLAKEEPADPAGTAELAAKLDRAYTDAAPWVPLTTPRSADLTSARVGNFQASPYQFELLEQMWVR